MVANPKDSTMKLHWILLVASVLMLTVIAKGEKGSSITTKSLVEQHGYPFEKHQVQTTDGYLLNSHRMPYSARVNTPSPRPVAFLMHGLLTSSSDWVLLGPGKGLAFILSDVGFDIWMGNARGNRYSRNHITLSTESKLFWNFTFHEIGMIDLPSLIDYVLLRTGEDQVRYFGHSQGCTTFMLLNSLDLKFKSRIKSAHLLAPATFMNNIDSPVFKFGAPLLGQPNPFVELTSKEFLPNTKAQELLGYKVCRDTSPTQFLCLSVVSLLGGYDPENLNTTMLPEIFATFPAGGSINQLYHYMQEYNSGYFRQFDYGPARNLLTYGSVEPPSYPLEKIDVPIFLYYGKNDLLLSEMNVQRLIRKLPNSTLQRAYLVEYPKWNHFDFLWGLNAKDQVYDVIMEDVASI